MAALNDHTATQEASARRIRRIGVVLGVLTFMLIVWGGHVNSTRSGMAFPDWPTSNAAPMMTYEPSKWLWEGDKFWEHGHRLFASLVGLVTTVLLVVSYRQVAPAERPNKAIAGFLVLVFGTVVTAIFGLNTMPAGFMEFFMLALAVALLGFLLTSARRSGAQRTLWLAMAAFAAVCLQGAFGGYTVRNNLPDWTSTTHGMLAEIFFMIVIGITYLNSPLMRSGTTTAVARLRPLISITWGLTFLQFFLGALTRHSDAWGVSVTFPHWSDEGFFPSAELLQFGQVAIHFLHRTTAYVVAAAVLLQWWMVRKTGSQGTIARTTSMAALLVGVQILLGAMILWTARGEVVTTLHVLGGVGLLALNTVTLFVSAGLRQAHTASAPASAVAGGGVR